MLEQAPLIRRMHLSDLSDLMRLKEQAGWNQTLADWRFLIEGEDNVNYVLEYKNTVIGSVTAKNYNHQLAWIGMMLIDRDHRGQGLSKLLLNQVIDELHNCKAIKLDATPAGLPVYKSLGFTAEYKIWRWTNQNVKQPKTKVINRYNIQSITEENFGEIVTRGTFIFGARRRDLLSYLRSSSKILAQVVLEGKDVLVYSLGREGSQFSHIGPLCASSDEVAISLLDARLHQLHGKAAVIDVIEDKVSIGHYLKQSGFTTQRPLERMYLKANVVSEMVEEYYLIAGPEFG